MRTRMRTMVPPRHQLPTLPIPGWVDFVLFFGGLLVGLTIVLGLAGDELLFPPLLGVVKSSNVCRILDAFIAEWSDPVGTFS